MDCKYHSLLRLTTLSRINHQLIHNHFIISIQSMEHQINMKTRLSPAEVANYDFDKKFPVLGFGGILPSTGETSHCFNVNLTNRPMVDGIDNVIKAYRSSLDKIKLDGPTYFSPLIKNTIQIIKENESTTSIYHILLIITDGTIHDFKERHCKIILSSF